MCDADFDASRKSHASLSSVQICRAIHNRYAHTFSFYTDYFVPCIVFYILKNIHPFYKVFHNFIKLNSRQTTTVNTQIRYTKSLFYLTNDLYFSSKLYSTVQQGRGPELSQLKFSLTGIIPTLLSVCKSEVALC